MTTNLTSLLAIGSKIQGDYWTGNLASTGAAPYNRYIDITLPQGVDASSAIPMVFGGCSTTFANCWASSANRLYCELMDSNTLRVSSPSGSTVAAFRWYVISV